MARMLESERIETSQTCPLVNGTKFCGDLDENGNFSYTSKPTLSPGTDVPYTAIINSPDGVFNNIEIQSSASKKADKFTDIKTCQPFGGTLKTKFGSTTITITAHSDTLKNVHVTGEYTTP